MLQVWLTVIVSEPCENTSPALIPMVDSPGVTGHRKFEILSTVYGHWTVVITPTPITYDSLQLCGNMTCFHSLIDEFIDFPLYWRNNLLKKIL